MRTLKPSRLFALLTVLALIFLIPFTALADNTADEKGSLSIAFFNDNAPISGAHFSIYRVAEPQGADYTLTGDFEKYQVSLDDISNADRLGALTNTFAAYIARDSIPPYAEGETSKIGGLHYKNLEDGLYIGIGDPIQIGDTTYIPLPFMFAIPGSIANGERVYNVVVEPKYDLYKEGVSPDTVDRRVLKIWDDNANESGKRSAEITVQLLKDGEIYEEIILSEDNDWRYSWNDLPAEHQWIAIEKDVPDDYVILMDQQGITFTLTNTYIGDEPEETTKPTDTTEPTELSNPTAPTNPTTPTNPSKPSEPTNPNTPDMPSTPSEPTLPQTGQLWWPVPVLLIAGIIICLTGIVLKKRSEKPNA